MPLLNVPPPQTVRFIIEEEGAFIKAGTAFTVVQTLISKIQEKLSARIQPNY